MKVIKKGKMVKENKIKPIFTERNIMLHLDHPLIVRLYWSF